MDQHIGKVHAASSTVAVTGGSDLALRIFSGDWSEAPHPTLKVMVSMRSSRLVVAAVRWQGADVVGTALGAIPGV